MLTSPMNADSISHRGSAAWADSTGIVKIVELVSRIDNCNPQTMLRFACHGADLAVGSSIIDDGRESSTATPMRRR